MRRRCSDSTAPPEHCPLPDQNYLRPSCRSIVPDELTRRRSSSSSTSSGGSVMELSIGGLDRRKNSWLTTWGRWALVTAVVALSMSSPADAKTQADYFVSSLPGQPDGPLLKMHAGYASVLPQSRSDLTTSQPYRSQSGAQRPPLLLALSQPTHR